MQKHTYNTLSDYYNNILGAYTPDIMKITINTTYDNKNTLQTRRVYFHERYHYWQSIFTPFGQMRWFQIDYSLNEVYSIWKKSVLKNKNYRKIPSGLLIEQNELESSIISMHIEASKHNLDLLFLMLQNFWNKDLEHQYSTSKEYLNPKITVSGDEYILTGLDIIETLDKYQEALYGKLINKETFEDIIDPNILNSTYFMCYNYYLEQIGNDIAFPAVCEIALKTSSIGDLSDINSWKKNHPAWRFISIIDVLKNNKKIPVIKLDNIEKTYSAFVNSIIKECGFRSIDDTYKGMRLNNEGTDWENVVMQEMNRAMDFKQRYPWFLAYPFFLNEKQTNELNSFQPNFISYIDMNSIEYVRDNVYMSEKSSFSDSWKSELHNIIHKYALAYQIMGIESNRALEHIRLQCGCGFFNVNACPHFNKDCNGYLDNESSYARKLSENDIIRIIDTMADVLVTRHSTNSIDEFNKYKNDYWDENSIDDICYLDLIFQIYYGCSVLDVDVNMLKKNSLSNCKEYLDRFA